MAKPRDEKAAAPRSRLAATLLAASVYVILGEVSFTTAFVQTNTAAVWIPSGYAVGLLIVFGVSRWPAVTLGSFVLNAIVNIGSHNTPIGAAIAVALAVALGNTGEAIVGAIIARRFASGPLFFTRTHAFAVFAFVVVPVAPLFSMGIGVAASRIGGLPATGTLPEIMVTWYVANAVGLLIVTGPVVALLTKPRLPRVSWGMASAFEAIVLACGLVFASQAICGLYASHGLEGLPKTYMIVPLLFWASFRFGGPGAFLSIFLVALISVIGTMVGFEAFPATTPSRSLIYLQIFLGMVSIMTFALSAGLTEARELQDNLEAKVRARTQDLERYLREREVFTTLVAHDLQSPLYGVRNALRALTAAIPGDKLSPKELVSALVVMEETCSALADRVTSLLTPQALSSTSGLEAVAASDVVPLTSIVAGIAVAHRLKMQGQEATLQLVCDDAITIRAPDQVEHILDCLVDNAIRYSAAGSKVTIEARRLETTLEISVIDQGPGVRPDRVASLFQSRVVVAPRTDPTGSGIGLYLAREQARALGGELAHVDLDRQGATFRLTLPR